VRGGVVPAGVGPPGPAAGGTSAYSLTSTNAKALRFRHLIRHLHRLGPRPCGEALLELACDDHARLIRILENYARFEPRLVRALNADDWAPPVLWKVPA
jgi:hypothetical protein